MARHDAIEYGAVGDGETDDTAAIQAAIDAAAEDGGGTVVVPAGEYVTRPLLLRSHVEIRIEGGAILLGSEDIDEYPAVEGRWEGAERDVYASLLTGHDLEDVAITGSGTLHGRGEVWWEAFHDDRDAYPDAVGRDLEYPGRLDCPRPRMINIYDSQNVLIRDIEIRNSPSWTVHPVYCENVTIDNVTIRNPEHSTNTDGINPDSCRNVRISNCDIDAGDDCITIKSGYDEDGRRVGEPCENVVVTNCTMYHGHGGVVIGSEMAGGVRNVTVSNCVFDGTDNGLRVKTERGRGSVVENIRATNLVMRDLKRSAFIATMFYQGRGADEPRPVTEETPRLREMHYSDITIDGTTDVTTIRGLPEMPVEDVSLSNVRVRGADRGVRAANVDGFDLRDVSVDAEETPAFDVERASEVELTNVEDPDPDPDRPVVRLDGADAVVRGCVADRSAGAFLEHTDSDVVLLENHLDAAERDGVARD
ncbi:glycoside hydrolase family 28 protein [Halosimplex aquaticum]